MNGSQMEPYKSHDFGNWSLVLLILFILALCFLKNLFCEVV
jgi:hypothetical protein